MLALFLGANKADRNHERLSSVAKASSPFPHRAASGHRMSLLLSMPVSTHVRSVVLVVSEELVDVVLARPHFDMPAPLSDAIVFTLLSWL